MKADGTERNAKLIDGDVFTCIKKACKMGLNKSRTIVYSLDDEEEEEEEQEEEEGDEMDDS